MKYKVILFDLDGTIFDSQEGITKSVQYALAKVGVDEPDLSKLTRFIGPPITDSFGEFYGLEPARAEQAVEHYRERFRERGYLENKLFPGIEELLASLKKRGFTLAVATSKMVPFTEKALALYNLRHYFEHVACIDYTAKNPGKVDTIGRAIKHFSGFAKGDFVMIGDRKHDIEGARENGIDSIGAAYGYGGVEELKAHGATHIVHNVRQIKDLLTA